MKKRVRNKRTVVALSVAASIAVLILLALLLKGTGYLPRMGYEAHAPTSVKFARLARFIPAGMDFDVTIDVPRALANPSLSERLATLTRERAGVAAELVAALLSHQDALGLITITGTLGSPEKLPAILVIAQGNFDERVILPAVRAAMAAGRAGLASQDLGWATLFTEADVSDPFGFIVLDREHLAVGSRDTLQELYAAPPQQPPAFMRAADSVLFGHVALGDRLKEIMPSTIAVPASADFVSEDGVSVRAWLACPAPQEALDLRIFLEGVRSLLLLQQEESPALTSIIKGFAISGTPEGVLVESPVAPLIDLWVESGTEPGTSGAAAASGKEGNDPAGADVQ